MSMNVLQDLAKMEDCVQILSEATDAPALQAGKEVYVIKVWYTDIAALIS